MSIKIGLLGTSHVHAGSYARALSNHPSAELSGHFESDPNYAPKFDSTQFASASECVAASDAVIICGKTVEHLAMIELAAQAQKPILCEKPVPFSEQESSRIRQIVESNHVLFMTAFPCPFSPAFQSALKRIKNSEIGKLVAIAATNRARFPGLWYDDAKLSGGGAIMDHVVHVADLLRRITGQSPNRVHANAHPEGNEKVAMLTLDYADGTFATLDSSWSRPKSYKTWGDVTLNIVGELGVIELDLFGQTMDVYGSSLSLSGYGPDLDQFMVSEFVSAIQENRAPSVTLEDGLMASQVVWSAYQSLSPASA